MTKVSQRQMVRLFNFHEQICYALISKKSAEFVRSLNLKANAFAIKSLTPKRIEIQIGDSEDSIIRTNLIDYWGKGTSIIPFSNNRPKRWIYLNIGILEFLKLLSEIYHCKFLRFHFGYSHHYPPMEIIEKLSNGFQIDSLILLNQYVNVKRILKHHLPAKNLTIQGNVFLTMQEYEEIVLIWEF
ncbi:Protein CBG25813 [Caenorhabditis briggsae]|uniref:Protein CBG25813 n=1 Tax=Caenorhabditis briggsae TaxID=6238 RepID=B6IJV6_CAEBR|nr:Protein CBG25813 [Caenorhabditis briggsae]CAS00186.1 Protein CBG25813 [Caenorhabditis briggsae]